MPLYEYQCDACGHRFETIQRFSDAPLEVCPKCGGHVRKLQSAPAFQFKGSGWYVTDYGKKDSASAEKGSEKGSEKSAESAGKDSKSSKDASAAGDAGAAGKTDKAPPSAAS